MKPKQQDDALKLDSRECSAHFVRGKCLKKTNDKAISLLERIINETSDKFVKKIKDAFAMSVQV